GKIRLQPRQGEVGGVRGHGVAQQLAAALVVKAVYQGRIGGKSLRGGHVLDAVLLPEAIAGAKGSYPRLGGNTGAGEHQDAAVTACHGINPSPASPGRGYGLPGRRDPADW